MQIGYLIIQVIVLMMAITFHEFAHGWVARKLGDRTAELEGRLSLNPIHHIDPVGTILLPLIALMTGAPLIGWAKPVPINAYNFRDPKAGMMWSAAAGPMMNILLAVIGTLLLKILFSSGIYIATLQIFLNILILLNVRLAVFNMLPIPPLDGGRVLVGLLPKKQSDVVSSLEPYGFFIIMGLVLLGVLHYFLIYPTMIIIKLLDSLLQFGL